MFDKTARLERIARRYPRLPLFARLADSYLSRGKVRRARELCEESCRRFPGYPTGYLVLSRCYEGEGRLEEARVALDTGLRLDPLCPAAFRQLSRLYRSMGNPTLATRCLEVACQLEPLSDGLAEELQALAGEEALPETAAASPAPLEAETARWPGGLWSEGLGPAEQGEPAQPVPGQSAVGSLAAPGQPGPGPAPVPDRTPVEGPADLAPVGSQDEVAALGAGLDGLWVGEAPEQVEGGPLAAPPPLPGTDLSGDRPERAGALPPLPVGGPAPGGAPPPTARHRAIGVARFGDGDEELVALAQDLAGGQEGEASAAPSSVEAPVRPVPTATLARLYAAQGFRERAIEIYHQVLERQPGNPDVRAALSELEGR